MKSVVDRNVLSIDVALSALILRTLINTIQYKLFNMHISQANQRHGTVLPIVLSDDVCTSVAMFNELIKCRDSLLCSSDVSYKQ